jgi:cytochrome oxidase Cu insertion factor (SCO1/SenC/PrrC family)
MTTEVMETALGTDRTEETGASNGPPSRPSRALFVFITLALLALIGWIAWPFRDHEGTAGPLPVVAALPDFTLTERSGRTVTKSDLRGIVWVADFIFSTCAGPCPELTLRMSSLCKALADLGDGVKCVSVTVDPTYDRPAVLAKYADRYAADADGWWFVTGDEENAVHELVTAGFLQALSPAKGGSPIIHSTRFVLIDKLGRIRTWHDGLDPASKRQIIADVKYLLAEPLTP